MFISIHLIDSDTKKEIAEVVNGHRPTPIPEKGDSVLGTENDVVYVVIDRVFSYPQIDHCLVQLLVEAWEPVRLE